MPPPRGGVQAASVVCGDHPELITYAELHAGCHMGTGPMRSRPICESERLIVWLPLSRGYVAPWRRGNARPRRGSRARRAGKPTHGRVHRRDSGRRARHRACAVDEGRSDARRRVPQDEAVGEISVSQGPIPRVAISQAGRLTSWRRICRLRHTMDYLPSRWGFRCAILLKN